MADDIQSNIRIGIDTTDAISSIKNLQRKISAFHTTMAQGSAANAAAAANLQRNLLDSINATGKFSANITKIRSTTESFTDSLEKNKFSIGQYFRYAAGASKSFGKIFTNEFATIDKVARERVKSLQTQYIKLSRDANGALQAIKVRPLVLDMDDLATKTAIAAQKQQLLNQLLKQGSTNLLNFGKNTQWAGRQLMVGFTIPLSIFGTTAAKTFMQMEEQAIRFKRVYGEMFTTDAESDKMLKNIKRVASEFTKYGVAVEKTMGLAADAAAMGKQGNDLIAQVREANRLAVLGQVEQAQALETTISVTNAFGTAAEELAGKIDFLNAVENQTVTSIEDLTIAVPKAGPVVKQLGGDVEDLAFFLTAMKEGGINASEGANALKSGLASIINPTKKATEMLAGYGINVTKIVESNKGDVKGTVIDFATALDKLDPLKRARAIEQLFGKFQFARLSTLFKNVIGEGTQAQRVLDLAASTSGDLAKLSARELSRVSESPMYKFKKAIEDIKAALAPIGEIFLKLATPLIEFGTKALNAFNNLDEKTKSFVTGLIAVVGGLGPVMLMTFGLLANGVANLIKGFVFVKNIFNKTTAASQGLAGQLDYMTQSQLDAAAIAASLDQSHSKLIQTFSSEAKSVNMLTAAYRRSIAAQGAFNSVPAISRTRPTRLASGTLRVPGPKGAGDVVPAMLSPGEAVIPADKAQKYSGFINDMISGNVPGYFGGGIIGRMMNRSRVATRMPGNTLLQMLGRGDTKYRSAFETGTGADYLTRNGLPNKNQAAERRRMELSAMGIGWDADASQRPTYGSVATVNPVVRFLANIFGGITGRQFSRITNPLADSLDIYGDTSLIGKRSIGQRSKMFGGDILRSFVKQQSHWIYRKQQGIELPTMYGGTDFGVASGNLQTILGRKFGSHGRGPSVNGTPSQWSNPGIPYIESYTPGGFDLKEVAKIVTKNPELVPIIRAALKEQGIKIPVRAMRTGILGKIFGFENGTFSVPGPKGAGDIVPAMLSPQEAVIPAKAAKKYSGLVKGIISDNVPGFFRGKKAKKKVTSASGRQRSHLQGALDPNDPEVRKQILEQYPDYDQMPQSIKDRISFTGSLTAELGGKVNQRLKEKGGMIADEFDSAWGAIENKLLSSAVAGGMDENDPEARKALKEIEVKVGKRASELARKAGTGVTDAFLMSATDEILEESKKLPGKTAQVARQLESRKKVLGDVRSDYTKEELTKLIDQKVLSLEGSQIKDPKSGIPVGDNRRSKSGKNPTGYKQKTQGITKFGGYRTTPFMSTVVDPSAALLSSQASETATVTKKATEEAKARVKAEVAVLGKEENDPYSLQRSEQRNSPHPQAAIDGADDAKARIAAERAEYRKQSRRVTAVPNGEGGMQVIASPALSQANARNNKTPRRVTYVPVPTPGQGTVMDAQGNAIEKALSDVEPAAKKASFSMRGLSFALSSLSTAALMSGQLTGDFGNAVLGATYGLTALTEMASLAKTSGLVSLVPPAATGSKVADFFGKMINVGGKAVMTVGRLAGIVGIAITVISGFTMLNNWINDQREKERLKIEGLGDAATLTAKKLKAIGNFYGKEPVKTAFAGAGSSIGPATAEKRATVNTLSSNKEFQEAFKTDIAVLKKATVKQTKQAFETLSLSLFAQGYDKKTIQDIIDTLRKEAGKTKVTFDVASIDIKTKGGKAAFKKSVDTMVKDYQAAFDKGYKKELYVETSGNMVTGQGYKNTKDFDANLDTTAANLSERINALQTLFDNGQISLKDYTTNMNLLKKAMTEGKGSTELAQKVFKNFVDAIEDPEIKKLIGNVQGASNQFLIMQATMTGVITTADELAKALEAINIITDYQKNGDKSKYSFSQYRQAIQDVTALGKAVAANSKEQEKLNEKAKDYGTGDGTGDESAFTKAKKDIVAQTKEIQNQINAFRRLKAAGIDTDKAFKMASNSMLAAALASETVGSAKWKEIINLYNTLEAKQKSISKLNQAGAFEEGYSKVQEAFSAYEEQANAAFKGSNKKDLDLIEETESKIAALSYKLEGYQSILDDIQLKEDEINDSYDKKIEALDTVAKINERLIAQQKSQLTIADALTRGDISAAAAAIQDQRAQEASASAQEQSDMLEKSRQAALGGVTVNGKTRLDIEKQIRDTSAEIKKLEDESLKPATERIRLADEKLQADIKAKIVAGQTKEQWDLIAANIALAKTNTIDFTTALNDALSASAALQKTLDSKKAPVVTPPTEPPATPAKTRVPLGGGVFVEVASGGHISGPGTGTSDSIPAWLSDGEYVVKASAVKNIGVDALDRINNAKGFAGGGKVKSTSPGSSMEKRLQELRKERRLRGESTGKSAKALRNYINNPTTGYLNLSSRASKAELESFVNKNKIAAGAEMYRSLTPGELARIQEAFASGSDYKPGQVRSVGGASDLQRLGESAQSSKVNFGGRNYLANTIAQITAMEDLKGIQNVNRFGNLSMLNQEGVLGPQTRYKLISNTPATATSPGIMRLGAYANSFMGPLGWLPALLEGGKAFTAKKPAQQMYSMGGIVKPIKPRYFSDGDLAKGTDIIPAMLTPGEFVIKKSAVDNIGVDNLRAINRGASLGESVYNNYELNVNVRSDSDANDIARTVMAQIRQIDSQRVRGIRL